MSTEGIFDDRHAPSRALVDDCVHCGFCLPACPTYVLWGQEADSPRGRIHLMRAGLEGRAEWTDSYQRHFDSCLGCMACLTACPSGVRYDRLIEATRPQVERHGSRSVVDRFVRAMIFALFPYPNRMRALAWPLWLYQRSGLQTLVRASGVLKRLPRQLEAMERLLPRVEIRRESTVDGRRSTGDGRQSTVDGRPLTADSRRLRVGLLLGCVQRVFFPRVNDATVRVLTAEGCDVRVPADQGCCGALMLHAGRDREAAAAARALIDAFDRAGVERIVINAAGCGSAMKEYGELLRDDPAYADRARAFAAKCADVSELLAELEPRAPRRPLAMKVAYHDACHLQHAQRIREQPRRVLRTIPGLEVRDIADADICCGSAGIYNIVEPGPAAELRDRKVAHLLATGADAIVSSNPGCLIQLSAGLEIAGRPMPVMHLVELLDRAITTTAESRPDRTGA